MSSRLQLSKELFHIRCIGYQNFVTIMSLASEQLSVANYTLVSVIDAGIETVAYFIGDQQVFGVLTSCSLQVQGNELEVYLHEGACKYPIGFFPYAGYYVYVGDGACEYQEIDESGRRKP